MKLSCSTAFNVFRRGPRWHTCCISESSHQQKLQNSLNTSYVGTAKKWKRRPLIKCLLQPSTKNIPPTPGPLANQRATLDSQPRPESRVRPQASWLPFFFYKWACCLLNRSDPCHARAYIRESLRVCARRGQVPHLCPPHLRSPLLFHSSGGMTSLRLSLSRPMAQCLTL